jgi:hypothetical protein
MPKTLMMIFFMSASAAGGSVLTLGSFAQPLVVAISVTSPTPLLQSSTAESAHPHLDRRPKASLWFAMWDK